MFRGQGDEEPARDREDVVRKVRGKPENLET